MSTELVPFKFAGVPMNAVREGEEFFFIVAEVCKAIEHTKPTMFVTTIPVEEKGVKRVYTLGGEQNTLCITEKGLYMALMRSNKPKAKPFQEYVANLLHELRVKGYVSVLPDSGVPVTKADINELKAEMRAIRESSNQTVKMLTEVLESWKRTPNLSLKGIKANADFLSLRQYFIFRGWAWGTNGVTNQSLGRVIANVYRLEYGEDPVVRYDGVESERTVYPQDFLDRYFNSKMLGDGKGS
jgi:prophage antirepressor-like protein